MVGILIYYIVHMVYLLAATKLGQGNVFTGICDSVHRGGCLPQCMLGYQPPPRSRPPTTRPPPPGAEPPPPGSRLWHTVNERLVRNQLECILVGWHFANFPKTLSKLFDCRKLEWSLWTKLLVKTLNWKKKKSLCRAQQRFNVVWEWRKGG